MEPQSSPRRMENVAHPRRLDAENAPTKDTSPDEPNDSANKDTSETPSSPRRMVNEKQPTSQLDDEEKLERQKLATKNGNC